MKRVDVQRNLKVSVSDWCRLALWLATLAALALSVPSGVVSVPARSLLLALGLLGLWRYGWWLTHFLRSQVYARFVFPRWRRDAETLWQSGWRPARILYMLTTFKEVRSTTEKVLQSIIDEIHSTGIPARIFFGTKEPSDERIVTDYLRRHAAHLGADLVVVFVRQELPGKRVSIGLALRAMSRHGVMDDDLVVFMDGDTYLEPGLLRKCLPLFALRPELDALTTDEHSTLHGPAWMQWWLDMRLAQRHLTMQSIALSGKLLTLTGRCSLYRARHVVEDSFIRLVEADYLDHWLWGRFRFLSGDDKSTAYALLSKPGGAVMAYVPDAVACTIEYVAGGGFSRVRQNLLRWSGNLLRNGKRCIALGPQQLGWFAWWCFVDQRIAMWTTLIGPIMALALALLLGPHMLWAAVVVILITRTLLSLFLYSYAGRVYLSFPWLLYGNQIVNALVKVCMLFALAKQRWRNRGDQKSEVGAGWLYRFQNVMSTYLTALHLGAFVFVVLFVFVLQSFPRLPIVQHVMGRG